MTISNKRLARIRKISVEVVELLRKSRGTTNATLERLPEGALRRAIRRLNYPDMPRARHEFTLSQARDDSGRIALNALGKAFKELRALRAGLKRPRVAGLPAEKTVKLQAPIAAPPPAAGSAPPGPGAPAPAAGLVQGRWVWLGPGNIGGRTRAIVIHPTQPERMWAASAGGGVWRTESGGVRWDPVDDFMANLAVSCMVMDPKKPNTMYAGTGEGFYNSDALRGAGLFRTTDGVTWKQIPSTAKADFEAVNRLAISPSATVLLAATRTGIMRSGGAQRTTWTHVLTGEIADVKFHPKLSTRAVAGGLRDGQAWYTTNGGSTWKLAAHATPWSGRVELAYSVKNPNIVYASIQMDGGEIWRSTDGGKTYVRRASLDQDGNAANYLGDQGWYGNAIWAGDPTNENLVIVGGVDLWKSTDGGNSLREISTWWAGGSVHADHHVIVSHPGYNGASNRALFFGNDGGVHKAQNISVCGSEANPPYLEGWTELVNNYGVTQFFGGAGNPTTGKIVGGAQDNGTVCYDPAAGAESWKTIFGGDGGWCAADPTNPNVFYGEYVYLNIHRNTDGGKSDDTAGDRYISGQFWNAAAGEWTWKPLPFRIPDAMNFDSLFIAPFILDPNNASRILAGGLSLWETTNAKAANTLNSGPRWRSIKSSQGEYISAIAVARGNSSLVWVGHEHGSVFKSTNATAAQPVWQRMGATGAQPLVANRYCTRIAVDPADSRIVYVAFGGFVKENIWVTRDGGAKWTNLGTELPAAPVKGIAIHPRRTNHLYLGTEVGLFASENSGQSWSPTNEGPANVAVDDLFWMNETLVCATHGRGMFKIDLSGV
jgi:hypothetical protein